MRRLADAPTALDFPFDRSRPTIRSYRGEVLEFTLPATVRDAVKAFGQRESATSAMVLLAVFQTLLYCHTGQDDIVVGSPIANRGKLELEDVMGYFVSAQALRTDFSGNPTFREILDRVRAVSLEAYEHEDAPFDEVVKRLAPQRDPGRNPVFQFMFTFVEMADDVETIGNLSASMVPFRMGTAKFDLLFGLADGEDGMRGWIEYSTDLFDPSSVTRFLAYFRTLLQRVLDAPDLHISGATLVPDGESEQVLRASHATGAEYERQACLHTLFEELAAQTPDATAVWYEGGRTSYRELNEAANRLAHVLREHGIGPDTFVGLCMDRRPELVVGVLGILKAGGAFVALDPSHPESRLAFVLEDTAAPVVLTGGGLAARLESAARSVSGASAPRVIDLDAEHARIAQAPSVNPPDRGLLDAPAYVVYTSGSTGLPKGVVVENRSIANHCRDVVHHYGLNANDRFLLFAQLVFDASLEQLFCPLVCGAAVVVAETATWDLPLFDRKLAEFGVTVIDVPPVFWHQLAQYWQAEPSEALRALRIVVSSADVMRPETLRTWLEAPVRHVRLLNSYGPTEATVATTVYDVPRDPNAARALARIPIGRPFPCRRVYILTADGKPVPIGVPGELCIGGSRLARGYLNRAELTREKFVPDPFNRTPGSRYYRTGDLVRRLPDGNIEFLGRIDQQVKLRGYRIELGEIESALRRHPAVESVAARVCDDGGDGSFLAAYVVPRAGSPPAPGELRALARRSLPHYMVPAAFVLLERMPLTAGGKVDRRALPIPERGVLEPDAEPVAPRSPEEQRMAAIWSDVLGRGRVGVVDDFFELGGHSLLATAVIARVREAFRVELPLRVMFESPTVAGLTEAVARALHANAEPEGLKLTALPRKARPAK